MPYKVDYKFKVGERRIITTCSLPPRHAPLQIKQRKWLKKNWPHFHLKNKFTIHFLQNFSNNWCKQNEVNVNTCLHIQILQPRWNFLRQVFLFLRSIWIINFNAVIGNPRATGSLKLGNLCNFTFAWLFVKMDIAGEVGSGFYFLMELIFYKRGCV